VRTAPVFMAGGRVCPFANVLPSGGWTTLYAKLRMGSARVMGSIARAGRTIRRSVSRENGSASKPVGQCHQR